MDQVVEEINFYFEIQQLFDFDIPDFNRSVEYTDYWILAKLRMSPDCVGFYNIDNESVYTIHLVHGKKRSTIALSCGFCPSPPTMSFPINGGEAK